MKTIKIEIKQRENRTCTKTHSISSTTLKAIITI